MCADPGGCAVLRYKPAEARVVGSRVRILLKACKFVSCVCCVFCRYRSLLRADHSFRGILKGLCFFNCVWSRYIKKEAAGPDLCCCVTAESNIYVVWPANKDVGRYVRMWVGLFSTGCALVEGNCV